MKHDLHALKEQLLIPEIWCRLNLPGSPGRLVSSPFRPDRHPSFSIFDEGRRWKDLATGEGGDAIDFIAAALDTDSAEAIKCFIDLAGVSATRNPEKVPHSRPKRSLQLPPFRRATEQELDAVAKSRALSFDAVSLAHYLGVLQFGKVCGHQSWILTDSSRRIAEARTIDGRLYPPSSQLKERKAHTLSGSTKAWPLGTGLLRHHPEIRKVLLVEGGPDYLAALHFVLERGKYDALPVAILGRTIGGTLSQEALNIMAGLRVRIYPHCDPDGGGMQSAQMWAEQLHTRNCQIDFFCFDDLTRKDGEAVKDLNDAVLIDPIQSRKLEGLLP